jgi:hypothetical protein
MRKYRHLEEMKTQKRMHVWVKSIPDDVLMHVLLKMLSVIRHRKGRQIFSGTCWSENGIKIAAVSGPCAQRVDETSDSSDVGWPGSRMRASRSFSTGESRAGEGS